MMASLRYTWRNHLIWLLPATLAAFAWLVNPFAQPLTSKTVSLSELNRAQRINIHVAARAIDRCVLKPGEEFSFNRRVGPRTSSRGYAPARSYIGGESPVTIGGGICVLSSLLYQSALECGLNIEERVPHLRPVRTVPPGLDATVWYGQADLRFRNSTNAPLMISCLFDPNQLTVRLIGGRWAGKPSDSAVRTVVAPRSRQQLQAEVFRIADGKETLVSRDFYRLAP